MQNITEVVDLLEDKLLVLLEKYDFLKEENELLRNDLTKLQQELVEKERIVESSESTLQSMRVAQTIQGSNNNTRETTQKINTLIKEIDICIAQLSD
jgi:cell division septum initiation protein DivIVA